MATCHHRCPGSPLGPIIRLLCKVSPESHCSFFCMDTDQQSGYYSDPQLHRSMSDSFHSIYPPSLDFSFLAGEGQDFVPPRRRTTHDNRRQSKLRMRRTRLPSLMDAGLGSTQVSGSSVDFSFAAPSNTSTYVSDPASRSYSRQSFTSTTSSRGDYNDVVSGYILPRSTADQLRH